MPDSSRAPEPKPSGSASGTRFSRRSSFRSAPALSRYPSYLTQIPRKGMR